MRETLVNIPARRAYAEVLRRFVSGRMTTEQYENAVRHIEREHGYDAAVAEIYGVVWAGYDDIVTHRMTGGYRFGSHARRYIAQAILFLRTEATPVEASFSEVPLPERGGNPSYAEQLGGLIWLWHWIGLLLLVHAVFNRANAIVAVAAAFVGLALIVTSRVVHWMQAVRWQTERNRDRDAAKPFDVIAAWPFASRDSLTAARQSPTYLCGVRSVSLA